MKINILKKCSALLILLFALCLTGCVDIESTLDIEKNGDAKAIVEVGVPKYLLPSDDESIDELKELMLESLTRDSKENVQVDAYSEEDKTVFAYTEDLGNIFDENVKTDNSIYSDNFEVIKNNSLLFTEYDIKIKWNIEDFEGIDEMGISKEQLLALMGKMYNVKLNLKIPYQLEGTNANENSKIDNKYIYTWNINFNNFEDIQIKYKVPNLINILILILVFLSTTILLILILKKKKNVLSETNPEVYEEINIDSNKDE